MGVSIDAHVYAMDSLERDIDVWVQKNGGYREDAVQPLEFLESVCPILGLISDNKFIVVWNEYSDEYNPATKFLHAVDQYYFPGQDADFWTSNYTTIAGGSDFELSEVFGEEFEYGGKFSPEDPDDHYY